jgi:hypothetical protein
VGMGVPLNYLHSCECHCHLLFMERVLYKMISNSTLDLLHNKLASSSSMFRNSLAKSKNKIKIMIKITIKHNGVMSYKS